MSQIELLLDNDPNAHYELIIDADNAEEGDGVRLYLNRGGCRALADLFSKLAEAGVGHVHIGYTEQEPQGPGCRIIVNESGRSEEQS